MGHEANCLQLTLDQMVYGGDAMGRLPDGRAVFVPYALPGERVTLRLVEEKRGHARGEILELLEHSPHRIAARCPHYGECGGCHYQHLAYPHQLDLKRQVLQEQLQRIGGLENPETQATIASPEAWNYRNHVQFHLSPEGKLGFLESRSQQVLEISVCPLLKHLLNLLWRCLDLEPQRGLERIGLRLGIEDEFMLTLESQDIETPLVSVEGLPLSVVHLSPAGALVLAGSDHLIMEVKDRRFYVSAGSFFQVNTAVAEKMVDHLLEHLPLAPDKQVLELYCGVGLFSAFLAPQVAQLVGVESSPSACQDFVINLDEFDNVELYEATAEDVLPHLQLEPDILLLDPPRSGIDRRAMDAILAMHPPIIAYVSCDPSTLSRDSRRLTQAGYHLQQITPFDLFPQTYHIESISIWA